MLAMVQIEYHRVEDGNEEDIEGGNDPSKIISQSKDVATSKA